MSSSNEVVGTSEQELETRSDEDALDNTYRTRKQPRNFFKEGKVFLVLWAETASESASSNASSRITEGLFGQGVFSEIRRFVVIRADEDCCTALPISTYRGQGVSKRGVKKADHAIIYSGKFPPGATAYEMPVRGETGMCPEAIRVDPDQKGEKLDPMSRIDLSKPHTIHYNLRVKSFGKVNRASEQALYSQFREVWLSRLPDERRLQAGPAVQSSSNPNKK